MAYTNSGLVKYCKDALNIKTVYMWGGLMREVTENYINQLSSPTMYPKQYPESRKNKLRSLTGKGYYGCDCVGLIKSYYFGGVGTSNNAPGYSKHPEWDYGVGTMYDAAKTKGKIATMPQTDGILVMTGDFGHVGVYIGNGQVIECTLGSRGDGVVQTAFSAGGWTYWCQCPCIEDDTSTKPNTTTAKTENCNNIYLSYGVAAKRTGASTSAALNSRCVRGKYYPASQIVTPADSKQQWLRHAGTSLYSALTDYDGSTLFALYGKYAISKTNAVVNVRAAAGLCGAKKAQLSKGKEVYLTGKTAKADGLTWVQIVYNGELCWCDKQWIG